MVQAAGVHGQGAGVDEPVADFGPVKGEGRAFEAPVGDEAEL
jgi:hypothetical protein